ncbi:MAG: ferrous iron transport protein A [Tissierellia bacterium]|nr:ferrous iron transport protein A [Tissierellia bacterium]
MERTLDQLAIGEEAVVKKVQGNSGLKRRIMDMGLTRGTKVTLRRVAPLGDPMELTLRNFQLTLRKEDAKLVQVEGI